VNVNNATAWNPAPNQFVKALTLNGSTVYAGGAFTMLGGAPRSMLGAVDATLNTMNATAWNPGANGDVLALAVAGTTIYAGGWFSVAAGQVRQGLAALDATQDTDNATAWNPGPGTGNVLIVDGSRVYVGGSFRSIHDQPHSYFAVIGTITDPTDAAPTGIEPEIARFEASGPNPFGGSTCVSFRLARPGTVTLAVYDVAGREVIRLVDHRPLASGLHDFELDGRRLASGVYLCRLHVGTTITSRRLVHFR
jgi:hypothetical protein